MNSIQQSSNRLVAYFRDAMPKPVKGKRLKPEVVERAMQRFFNEVREERIRCKFGILSRARLALFVQKGLLADGCEPTLVRQVVFSLLLSALVGKG